jgi:hypothetical protein
MKPAKALMTIPVNPYQRFVEGKDPIQVLGATPKRLAKLIEGLSARQIRTRVVKDKWSICEIIGHLADCELIYSARTRWIAYEDSPPLVPFDQNAWADGHAAEREPVADTLARFEALRRSQLRLIRRIPAKELGRAGIHPEFGKITLELYIPWMAGHDLNHLSQISNLRQALLERAVS